MSSESGGKFFSKYRAAVLFNKNLIISGIGGFLASASISQIYSQYDRNELVNSAVALATEYAVYIPLFAFLFYFDNRQKYVDASTGKRNGKKIRDDIVKLFASFSVAELIFSIVRFALQYFLLGLDIPAYSASMLSSLTAWGVFFVAINIMAGVTRLHKVPRE